MTPSSPVVGLVPEADAVPAAYAVTFIDLADGGVATIYACPEHLAATVTLAHGRQVIPAVHVADPAIHGCKGHQDKWPGPGDVSRAAS